MKKVRLIAPAKVNLFLGIGQREESGYHRVTTVMHALSMHDILSITLVERGEEVLLLEENDPAQPLRQAQVKVQPGQGTVAQTRCVWSAGIAPLDIPLEDNLASRAVRVLAEELGRREDECLRIVIEKQIPYEAGLGGGSADAAAALLGAAHLWGVSAEDPALARAAGRLGADVCFFLHGGCALMEGRGEGLAAKLAPRKDPVVIIRPDQGGVSTAKAYALFDEKPQFFSEDELAAVRSAKSAQDVPLANNLQEPALRILPAIAQALDFASRAAGVCDVLLCGSGSAIFAICKNYTAAQALAAAACRAGYWARSTTFSSIKASILPERR